MKVAQYCHQARRAINQAALDRLRTIPSESLVWKVDENDPTKHTAAHEGLFYELPAESERIKIFGSASPFDPSVAKFHKVLDLSPIMIRQPALSAMEYLRQIEANPKPNIRLLFYGNSGQGKTHTLAHLIHYLHSKQDHFIVSVNNTSRHTVLIQDHSDSTTRPGRVDTPLESALLLQRFRVQNAHLIEKYGETLVCSQDYKWSLREVTKAGEPVVNIAEHGINRVIHASDCFAVLLKELVIAADAGKIKLATILDDVSLLFADETEKAKHKDFRRVYVDEITTARALKKAIKTHSKNCIVLAACDDEKSKLPNQTPRDVLGIEGWNHFDPFLPIQVPKFSRKEFESCMNLYQALGWLTRPESRTQEVRDEIRFVSGMNAGQVFELCKSI